MKKLLSIAVLGALVVGTVSAHAADALTLQTKWVAQAQFAGYYVAKAKGFYTDAGLDVTIKPGGPDIAPETVIAGGGADVIVDWLAAALAAREKGVPLVNIAQPYKGSGLLLTCRKDSGVATTADFKGKTLGVWFFGNEYPFYAWMAKLGLKTDGGADGVNVLKQNFNVDPLIQKQAACISTMSYNEYGQVLGRRPQALRPRRLQLSRPGRRHARGRPLCHAGQAEGPGLPGQARPFRRRLDEGLGPMPSPIPMRPPRSSSMPTTPAPRPWRTRNT